MKLPFAICSSPARSPHPPDPSASRSMRAGPARNSRPSTASSAPASHATTGRPARKRSLDDILVNGVRAAPDKAAYDALQAAGQLTGLRKPPRGVRENRCSLLFVAAA
jgi:hypothetical protein